jgi:hypothetical protein
MEKPSSRLTRLFQCHKVLDMATMVKALPGRSRRSLYRDLDHLGYHSSYTHAGRYYTLTDIPTFDDRGLWFYRNIGFCHLGTLKAALVDLIERAEAGQTHHELESLLHVRVHNTLLILVREDRVDRERIEKLFVYVSAASKRAMQQIAHRNEQITASAELPDAIVVEVLLEVIRAGEVTIPPSTVSDRLEARGVSISPAQVERVFGQCGLEIQKKTAASRSKHSRT